MKSKILLLSLMTLLTPLFVGCIDKVQTVPVELASDKEEVFVVADAVTGDGELSKTVTITSNRSWSAHLNDLDNPIDESDPTQSVPWGALSVEEHPNVTNVIDKVDLVIEFNRNYSKEQNNGVLNIYCEGKLRKSISLTQAGVVYKVSASLDQEGPVSDNGGTVFIDVQSNAHWTVKLDESSTADVKLLTTEGDDSGEIKLRMRSNDDAVEKTAKVIVSADECEDAIVEIKQSPVDPTIKFFTLPFTFKEDGGSKLTKTPLVVLDKAALDPDVVAAGLKIYYKMSTEGFSDDLIPDSSSDEFPESGVAFVVKDSKGKDMKFNEEYFQILAEAPGYRPVNLKLYCRHWRLGSTYDHYNLGTVDGLIISGAKPTDKSTYLVYDTKVTKIGTTAKYAGEALATRLFYNNTALTQMQFFIAGKASGSYTYANKETTSSKPDMLVSNVQTVKVGDDIHVENTNKKKGQIITFASMERFTYKP